MGEMMIRSSKALMLNNVKRGIRKLIRLVTNPVQITKTIYENLIIIIIKNRHVGTIREQQQSNEIITQKTAQLITETVEESSVITSENSYEIRQKQQVELYDSGSASDLITTDVKPVSSHSYGEQQDTNESTSETTATLEQSSLQEDIMYDYTTYSTTPLTVSTTVETNSPTDAIDIQSLSALVSSTSESQDSSDGILVTTIQMVSLNYQEQQTTTDSINPQEIEDKRVLLVDKQQTREIAMAYVPTNSETLVMTVLTESQQSSDTLMYSTSPAANAFNVSEWYVEYNATITLNYVEEQDSSDALTYETVTLQTLDYEESQDSSDEITYHTTTVGTGAFNVSEWYAEYQATIALNYTEEQDSSDALQYSLHNLVTTHPDTFEIGEWYAEYEVT